MTEKRFKLHIIWYNKEKTEGEAELTDNGQPLLITDDIVDARLIKDCLNELNDENEQLKQQINDCKKDKEQLSISFIEYKMQLIDVLQQNYNFAYNQRQKNLDNSIVAKFYGLLFETINNIAETMNVHLERFSKR